MNEVFIKDKGGNFRVLKSRRAAKEAGIENIEEFYLGTFISEMKELSKTDTEKLKEMNQSEAINEMYPVGFTPYNDVWRYKPVDSNYFARKFIGFKPTTLQQEALDIICGKDPFEFTNMNYEEADLMWGKRSGKDSTIALADDYQGYKLSCLVDPQEFLGLGKGSSIDIVNVASTAEQAKNVFFKYFVSYIKLTKDPETGYNWFATKNFYWDVGHRKFNYMDLREKDGDIKQKQVDFGRGISCHSLTSDRFTAEGLNIILAIMDEIGAMRPDRVFGTSEKMIGQYDSLSATVRSTSPKGFGKLVAISYKYGTNCPMSLLIKRNLKDPKKFVRKYSVYEVRTDQNEKLLRESFASEYAKDPEKAAMMYECKDPKVESDNLYGNRHLLKRTIDVSKRYSVNPFRGEIVTTSNISKGIELLESWFKGDENKYHAIHIDFASGRLWQGHDAAGIAMGHLEEMRMTFDAFLIESYKKQYGVDLTEFEGQMRFGVIMDLVLQVTCTRNQGDIQIGEIRKFVSDLHRLRKFNIFKVTIDRWQSTETIQEFNKLGIDAELLSVDRTPAAHHTQKDFVQLGLLKVYNHPIWFREMKELVEKNGKVDHPDISNERFDLEGYTHGSKDLADCTAGVCFTLSNELNEGGDLILG